MSCKVTLQGGDAGKGKGLRPFCNKNTMGSWGQARDTLKVDEGDNGRDNVMTGHPVGREVNQQAAVKVMLCTSGAKPAERSQGYREGGRTGQGVHGEERWLQTESRKFTSLCLRKQ